MAEVVRLRQPAQCQDCGADLLPGEEARMYVTRRGRRVFYCFGEHKAQAEDQAQAQPLAKLSKAQRRPQRESQPDAGNGVQVPQAAIQAVSALVAAVADLAQQVSDLRQVMEGIMAIMLTEKEGKDA